MSTKPRIFISHSTTEDVEAAGFRDQLADALRNAEFPVLLDKDVLELGDNWRPIINTWIGGCDVAIVLLSQNALESAYVAYETAVLTYRKSEDPGFHLWPILYPPITAETVEDSRLKPTMLTELQSALAHDDQTIAEVLRKLAQVAARGTPLDRCAQQLRDILEKVGDQAVASHLRTLKVDVRPWIPGEDERSQLAISMLAAGLPASVDFIRAVRSKLVGPDGDQKELCNLIKLLACSWVDYRSIKAIPEVARDEARRVLSVNAKDPLVARMYVYRAAVEDKNVPPEDSWIIGEMDRTTTMRSGKRTGAKDKGEKLYEEALLALQDPLGADNVAEALEELKVRVETFKEPVFVALRADAVTAEQLRTLRRRLKGVSLFLLTGKGPPGENLRELAVLLEPELEPGTEDAVTSTYTLGLALTRGLRTR